MTRNKGGKIKTPKTNTSVQSPTVDELKERKEEKPKENEKEKTRRRSRTLSFDLSEELMRIKQKDPYNRKKKVKVRKETEDLVKSVVGDLWETAWIICAERFFTSASPIMVSSELRDCWLRISEAEWQDRDRQESPMLHNHMIFYKEEPPLPLPIDSWSRGATGYLPGLIRESVMDPFLRHIDLKGAGHVSVGTDTGVLAPDQGISNASSSTVVVVQGSEPEGRHLRVLGRIKKK